MAHDPEDTLEGLQREVERLFHDLVYHRHPASHFSEPSWSPPADLVVSPTSARVLLELAGVPREQVHVRLRDRTLEVSGRREPPRETQGSHYHRAEIYFGNFRRTIELPWDADEKSIVARYRDGMLEIELKRVPARKTREVAIEEPRHG
ncbi:MAG TPA: Hsp20/alpha crystallin family protein [Candidatus Sulfotelmatobacter sp.]|nr:Hsp20/alpha crystallin family protein [Candidatus Sulfotelmatobacter sp.]